MPWPVGSRAGSILVVEDEVILRMDLADHLRSSGFAVLEAPNGDDALGVLNTEENVWLVITDMRMPGQVDGGVSGYLAVDALPASADARFRKPLNMETLLHQVRHLVDGTAA